MALKRTGTTSWRPLSSKVTPFLACLPSPDHSTRTTSSSSLPSSEVGRSRLVRLDFSPTSLLASLAMSVCSFSTDRSTEIADFGLTSGSFTKAATSSSATKTRTTCMGPWCQTLGQQPTWMRPRISGLHRKKNSVAHLSGCSKSTSTEPIDAYYQSHQIIWKEKRQSQVQDTSKNETSEKRWKARWIPAVRIK